MITGIVFDKDGTLFDFSATWRGFAGAALAMLAPEDPALQARLGAAVGFDLQSGAFTPGSTIVAGPTADIAAIWAGMLDGWSAGAIEDRANALAANVADKGMIPAVADLPALLDGLIGAGYALGVATHDGEAPARAHLAAVGALDRFDFICGYDSGHGLKPGPGMVDAFCAATGRRPGEVAMIGDSLHDLHAGRAAGTAANIAVLTGPAGRAELAPHADHVLDHIGDLPALLARIA